VRKISDDLLEDMTRRLVGQFQPEQVILFGSQAWGASDQYSDVDLMVIVDDSDLSDYARAVQAHRCLSGLNVPKDVIVKTRAEFEFFRDVRASLEHKIYKQGKVLYERSQKTASRGLAHESAT
jgi:predicted nucleotidyltransferase